MYNRGAELYNRAYRNENTFCMVSELQDDSFYCREATIYVYLL